MVDMYLHDDGALLFIHYDDRNLLKEVNELADQSNMKFAKDY